MTDVNGAADKRLVPALERGLKILEVLAEASEPQTGAELCRSTGFPRTSVHDLLHTLVALDYAREVDTQRHSYGLGPRVLGLGHSYLAGLNFTGEADRVVRSVSETTGETVQVAVLDGAEALYVAKSESRNALRLVSAVGRRLPAHLTGVGKALLAYLPEDELDRLFPEPQHLSTMTPHSIATLAELKRQLQQIRASGVAYDFCESNVDVSCVAAPVLDRDGRAVAGLSISFPVVRWNDAYRDSLSAQAKEAAHRLSRSLGGA